jgi:hypothetical protein
MHEDKTIREIAFRIRGGSIPPEEAHVWLSTASAEKLREFLQWTPIANAWSQYGRDALNILLANENIKLQKDIRDLTKKLHRLTIILAFIGLMTLYPIVKPFFNFAKSEGTVNQTTNTNQIQDSKNDTFNKAKVIKHK